MRQSLKDLKSLWKKPRQETRTPQNLLKKTIKSFKKSTKRPTKRSPEKVPRSIQQLKKNVFSEIRVRNTSRDNFVPITNPISPTSNYFKKKNSPSQKPTVFKASRKNKNCYKLKTEDGEDYTEVRKSIKQSLSSAKLEFVPTAASLNLQPKISKNLKNQLKHRASSKYAKEYKKDRKGHARQESSEVFQSDPPVPISSKILNFKSFRNIEETYTQQSPANRVKKQDRMSLLSQNSIVKIKTPTRNILRTKEKSQTYNDNITQQIVRNQKITKNEKQDSIKRLTSFINARNKSRNNSRNVYLNILYNFRHPEKPGDPQLASPQ